MPSVSVQRSRTAVLGPRAYARFVFSAKLGGHTLLTSDPLSRFHPQLPKQKRINIRPIFNLLGDWLALAVAGFAVNP